VRQIGILIVLLGALIFMFGEQFAMIFTRDGEIISMTEIYLRIMVFSYIFFATGVLATRVITGAGDTIRSLLIVSIILLPVQLPLVWLMALVMGLEHEGIWWGIFVSQIIFAAAANYHLFKKKWLYKEV
jgi:Na+-driven multidrug efflux pump